MSDSEMLNRLEEIGTFDVEYNEWNGGYSIDGGPWARTLREAIEERFLEDTP